jgi:hypothetical protein
MKHNDFFDYLISFAGDIEITLPKQIRGDLVFNRITNKYLSLLSKAEKRKYIDKRKNLGSLKKAIRNKFRKNKDKNELVKIAKVREKAKDELENFLKNAELPSPNTIADLEKQFEKLKQNEDLDFSINNEPVRESECLKSLFTLQNLSNRSLVLLIDLSEFLNDNFIQFEILSIRDKLRIIEIFLNKRQIGKLTNRLQLDFQDIKERSLLYYNERNKTPD